MTLYDKHTYDLVADVIVRLKLFANALYGNKSYGISGIKMGMNEAFVEFADAFHKDNPKDFDIASFKAACGEDYPKRCKNPECTFCLGVDDLVVHENKYSNAIRVTSNCWGSSPMNPYI